MSEASSIPGPSGLVDLHCHILPGLDDGARTPEVSLAMARKAASDGVGTIVATPHVFRDGRAFADAAVIDRACEALNRELAANGIAVEILPGAEVHVSHDLISEIKANRLSFVLNKGSYLCVEFPEDLVFSGTRDLFFNLLSDGITPIIAHPERNSVFGRDPELLYDLVRMGALSQANAGSLTGRYGSRAFEAARIFLKSNLIHFLASDGHDDSDTAPWLSAGVRQAEAVVGRERALALVRENPRAAVADKPVPDCPLPVLPGAGRRSFKIRIPKILRPKS